MAKPTKQQIARWKENRRKWVEALRSGEFEQANGVLFDGSAHCCLGVLAVVAGMKPRNDKNGFRFGVEHDVAPRTAVRFVGLTDENGSFDKSASGQSTSLTFQNDNWSTFSEIADIIESEPPGLFLESVESSNV